MTKFTKRLVPATFVSNTDGDTLVADAGFRAVVRLANIDCPEVAHTKQQRAATDVTSVAQYKWGYLAKQLLVNKVQSVGVNITITVLGFDTLYSRNIGSVVFADNTDLATLLIRQGLAVLYDKYLTPDTDLATLQTLQEETKQQSIGLWGDPNFITPSLFRAQRT